MENYDPLETVEQLKAWVETSLSSQEEITVHVSEAKRRYRRVVGVIDELEKLQFPVSAEIVSERESLEEMIGASNEREKLASLAKELSSLAKEINRQLRGEHSSRPAKGKRGPSKQLRVSFSDGTVVCEGKATDTFVRSIQCIGLQRVAELPTIIVDGHPLVSRERNESSQGYRELDGYFVETHLSTINKARYLQRIADALRIDVSVEVLD